MINFNAQPPNARMPPDSASFPKAASCRNFSSIRTPAEIKRAETMAGATTADKLLKMVNQHGVNGGSTLSNCRTSAYNHPTDSMPAVIATCLRMGR